MRKKRVLLVTGVFPPGVGGMQSYYYHLFRNSRQDVTVLAPSYTDDHAFDQDQDFPIIRGPFFKDEKVNVTSWWKLFRYTLRTIREKQIEVTVYGYILIGFIGWLLHVFSGREYIISTHGKDMVEFKNIFGLRRITKMILCRATGVLTNTAYTQKLVEGYGVDPDKIQLIYPGVDDFFEPQAKNLEVVERLGIANNYVLMTTGRLVRRKGHDHVIRALPEVLKAIPHAIYLIVGDGPERTRLEKLARDLGVIDHVMFVGYARDVQELKDYYNICDQFIMVSRELKKGDVEGFGIVYLEAASCKKAVIAGNSGGVAEAVVDGKTGLLVDPESIEAISAAILRLYHDSEFRADLGEAGYHRAKRSFRYESLSAQFDTYLANIGHHDT